MNGKKPGLWLNSAQYDPMWKRYNQEGGNEEPAQPWWFYWLVGVAHGIVIGLIIGATLWASATL